MTDIELLERLVDCVRLAIEDGAISPISYVATAWRDYVERYRFQSVTDEVKIVFGRIENPLVPKAALHKAIKQPAPAPVRGVDVEKYQAAIELLQIREDQIGEFLAESAEFKANIESLAALVLATINFEAGTAVKLREADDDAIELRRLAALIAPDGGG